MEGSQGRYHAAEDVAAPDLNPGKEVCASSAKGHELSRRGEGHDGLCEDQSVTSYCQQAARHKKIRKSLLLSHVTCNFLLGHPLSNREQVTLEKYLERFWTSLGKVCIITAETTGGGLSMATEFDRAILNPFGSEPQMKVIAISPEVLKPFANHPFKLYEGQRLNDFIQDIEEHGILSPVLVRKIDDEKYHYEILAGHNRVNAALKLGLSTVPAIICIPKNDEEAMEIVIKTNFDQRSIKDFKPSELANSLHMLNEAMKKKPGYRSDLQESENSSQADNRSRTMCVIGEKYGLSQATIARYIRVAKLSKGLLECLDNKLIGLGVAEHLSYLRSSEQEIVHQLLENGAKINVSQAQALKKESKEHELGEDRIHQIVAPAVPVTKSRTIRLKEELFTKYFSENQPQEEIEDTIAKALEWFRQQNPIV